MTKQEALKYVIEELEEATSVTSYGQEEHDHIDKLREAKDTLALIMSKNPFDPTATVILSISNGAIDRISPRSPDNVQIIVRDYDTWDTCGDEWHGEYKKDKDGDHYVELEI